MKNGQIRKDILENASDLIDGSYRDGICQRQVLINVLIKYIFIFSVFQHCQRFKSAHQRYWFNNLMFDKIVRITILENNSLVCEAIRSPQYGIGKT